MKKTWRKSAIRIQDAVTTAEGVAGEKHIQVLTYVPTGGTSDFVYNINIKRADIDKTANAKHFYNPNSGTVVVKTNSTDYVLTDGDVISISGTYV